MRDTELLYIFIDASSSSIFLLDSLYHFFHSACTLLLPLHHPHKIPVFLDTVACVLKHNQRGVCAHSAHPCSSTSLLLGFYRRGVSLERVEGEAVQRGLKVERISGWARSLFGEHCECDSDLLMGLLLRVTAV